MKRKVIQIATDAEGALALATDGSVWAFSWIPGGSGGWVPLPALPDSDADDANTSAHEDLIMGAVFALEDLRLRRG